MPPKKDRKPMIGDTVLFFRQADLQSTPIPGIVQEVKQETILSLATMPNHSTVFIRQSSVRHADDPILKENLEISRMYGCWEYRDVYAARRDEQVREAQERHQQRLDELAKREADYKKKLPEIRKKIIALYESGMDMHDIAAELSQVTGFSVHYDVVRTTVSEHTLAS